MSFARNAILQAAAHIEQHPDQFLFQQSRIPLDAREDTGCALGWVGHYMGRTEGYFSRLWKNLFGRAGEHGQLGDVARQMGFEGEQDFYSWMKENCKPYWTSNAKLCAAGLRKVAERV